MVALSQHASGIDAIPEPADLRREILALAQRLTLTKDLLRLSERVYGEGSPTRKAGNVSRSSAGEAAHVG